MKSAMLKQSEVLSKNKNSSLLRKVVGTEMLGANICKIIYTSKEAEKFLKHRPYFDDVLQQVTEKLKQYFRNAELYLRLIHDPDFDDDELLLSIVTEKTPEEALEILKKFDEEWWLDNAYLGGNKLNIDVMPL